MNPLLRELQEGQATFRSPWEAVRCLDFPVAQQLGGQWLTSETLEKQFEAHLTLGMAWAMSNRSEDAISSLRDAQYLCDRTDELGRNRIEVLHGSIQRELGSLSFAVDSLERAYRDTETSGEPKEIAYAMHNLALTYYRMERFAEAGELWESSEEYVSEHCHPLEWAHLQTAKALVATHRGDWADVAKHYQDALAFFTRYEATTYAVYALAGIAGAKFALGESDASVHPIRRALQRADAMDQTRYASLWAMRLADALRICGDFESAVENYQLGADLAMRAGLFTRVRTCHHRVLELAELSFADEDLLAGYRSYAALERGLLIEVRGKIEAGLRLARLHDDWRKA